MVNFNRVLLPGFVDTLKGDANRVIDAFKSPRKLIKERIERTNLLLSFTRIISTGLMGYTSYKAIRALPIIKSAAGIFKFAVAISALIIARDVFLLACNNSFYFGTKKKPDQCESIDKVLAGDKDATAGMTQALSCNTITQSLLTKKADLWVRRDVQFFAVKE